jgi:hypothetical protein
LVGREQARTKDAYALLAQEQARTRAAYESEARQRSEAEENFRQARQAVDFFARLSEGELRDKPETRRKFLEAALGYYQAFIEQQRDNPAVRDELVAGHEHVAAILTKIGQPADAQAAFKFLQGSGQLKLLGQESVQAELNLSPEQVRKIGELLSRRAELFRDFRGWGPDSWIAKAQKVAPVERAAVELLQPEQAKRLQEIILQQRGPQAFGDPEVAEVLQLTSEQRDRIRAIQEDRRSAAGPAFFPGGGGFMPGGGGFMPGGPRGDWAPPWAGGFRPGGKAPPGDVKKPAEPAVDEQLINVLTAAQKTKWEAMQGEPFRGEIRGSSPMAWPGPDVRFERR